jgi:serine palmitoyltransferase
MTAKLIPPEVTRQYEEDCDLSSFKDVELVNCASNNYGGFSRLEYGVDKVIESALHKLPFAPAPAALDQEVRSKCAAYMRCDACVTAPSGFSTNVLAFATVAGVARSQGRKLVFLCDRDCHNSMFTGAYFNKEARVHKFDHNDLTDLEYKLRMYREQDSSAFVCVAVEGIYRYVQTTLHKDGTYSARGKEPGG